MSGIYSKKYTPAVYDFDMNMNIKPSAVLNFLQDAAGTHSFLLKAGKEHLLEKGLFFALTKIRCDFFANIRHGSTITVKTAPGKKSKMVFMRDFIVTDENQNIIAKSASRWCLIDLNTRMAALSSRIDFDYQSDFSADVLIEPLTFDGGEKTYTYQTAYSDLDFNGHVNNAKYADAILNAVGKNTLSQKSIKSFQINYNKESLENQKIDFFTNTAGDEISILARCGEETRLTAKVVLCNTF